MRLLGICGSLQAESGNRRLLQLASTLVPSDVEFEIFEGLEDLPFFRPDGETDGTPEPVRRFRLALASSDGVILASPEYGHSLPGVLKNAIDWVISSGELYRKPVAVTASAPAPGRGERGLDALCIALGGADARILRGDPIARGPGEAAELAVLLDVFLSSLS